MRAVVAVVLVSVLAGEAAQAAECQPGHMSMISADGRVLPVKKGAHGLGRHAGRQVERTLLQGPLGTSVYTIDLHAMQGNSADASSYKGRPKAWVIRPQWGTGIGRFSEGDDIQIYDGPLRGKWSASCR